MSISVMAERMFAALDAGERDPLRLKAAVLAAPVEEIEWAKPASRTFRKARNGPR